MDRKLRAVLAADVVADIDKLETKASAKLAKICVDLSALNGFTPAAFADAAVGQIASTVASPCDSMDETRYIVHSGSDRSMGTYFLFDAGQQKLTRLFEISPCADLFPR